MFYYTTTNVQIDLLEEIGQFLCQFGLGLSTLPYSQGLVISLSPLSTRLRTE